MTTDGIFCSKEKDESEVFSSSLLLRRKILELAFLAAYFQTSTLIKYKKEKTAITLIFSVNTAENSRYISLKRGTFLVSNK